MKNVYYFANQVYQYGHAKPIYDKTGGTFIVNKLNRAARFKYYLRFTEKKDPGFLGAPRVIRKPKNEVYDLEGVIISGSNSEIKHDLLYRRGGSFERIGEYTKADRDLLHSIKINPNEHKT